MATVRTGNKPILLVVDVQVGVMKEAWDASRIINNVAQAVERARAEAVPVIWVQHFNDELSKGSAQWEWVSELQPGEGEAVVHKQFHSSFEQTALDAELAHLGATHIVLAGAATNWCIRATAYGALDRGYDLTVIKDAHTTESIKDDAIVIEAANVVQEFNLVVKCLEYPNRKSSTVNTNDLNFAALVGAYSPALCDVS